MTTNQPFSVNRALTAGQWAQCAYGLVPLPPGTNAQMFDGMTLLKPVDVQCLVVEEADRVTFAFRGTFNNAGWLQDAKIAFTKYPLNPKVKFHTGFYEDVDALWPQLSPIASFAATAGKAIYATGHSKGAGEVLPFVYRLAKEKQVFAREVFTFGGPRCFNRAGASDYDSLPIPTWRIMDEDDIVCRIPWRFGLYKHVGHSAFFDAWTNAEFDEPWYSHLPSDIYALFREAKLRENAPTADHSIAKDIGRLVAWKQMMGL